MRLTALLAVPLFAAGFFGSSALLSAPAGSTPAPKTTTQCRADETVIYSCRFGKSVGSICGTEHGVHYRFGPAGRPALDLANKPDWSNVHIGYVRGQGAGGYQEHIRFTNGDTHYIVYRGQNGELADDPGHTYSGISVQAGQDGGRTLATLGCTANVLVSGSMTEDVSLRAPDGGLDIAEIEGGPFDGWF